MHGLTQLCRSSRICSLISVCGKITHTFRRCPKVWSHGKCMFVGPRFALLCRHSQSASLTERPKCMILQWPVFPADEEISRGDAMLREIDISEAGKRLKLRCFLSWENPWSRQRFKIVKLLYCNVGQPLWSWQPQVNAIHFSIKVN